MLTETENSNLSDEIKTDISLVKEIRPWHESPLLSTTLETSQILAVSLRN
jgi:hypothetical protein